MIKSLARYCTKGHVNDLDMIQIGNGMNIEDEKTHFAMWCMMSTSLMIGCDLTKIDSQRLEILKNKELIVINQDEAYLQAFVIKNIYDKNNNLSGEIWIKDLGRKNSNEKAIAFLNRSEKEIEMNLNLIDAGLIGEIKYIRNVSNHIDEKCDENLNVKLKTHEAIVYCILTQSSIPVINHDDIGVYENKPLIKIDINEAYELVNEDAILVDVRTFDEYKINILMKRLIFHIPICMRLPKIISKINQEK